MKLFFYLFFTTTILHAATIEFIGPCQPDVLASGELDPQHSHLGGATLSFLQAMKIPHQGTERGLNSVFHTPVGDAALEIISPEEMKAYGWCYFVDGVAPEVFPSDYPVKNTGLIQWVYSFAHYQKGQWVAQCQKAYLSPPKYCR